MPVPGGFGDWGLAAHPVISDSPTPHGLPRVGSSYLLGSLPSEPGSCVLASDGRATSLLGGEGLGDLKCVLVGGTLNWEAESCLLFWPLPTLHAGLISLSRKGLVPGCLAGGHDDR